MALRITTGVLSWLVTCRHRALLTKEGTKRYKTSCLRLLPVWDMPASKRGELPPHPNSLLLTRMLLYMLPLSTARLTRMMQQSSTCWL